MGGQPTGGWAMADAGPAVALVPARGGSKRIPRKNVRLLAGHPLLAYAIAAARASGVFDEVYVSTEDVEIAEIAVRYGAAVIMRPAEFAADESPDIEWVWHALVTWEDGTVGDLHPSWSLLRPTAPFRTAETIQRAWSIWQAKGHRYSSLRAVEPTRAHPGKAWRLSASNSSGPLAPVLSYGLDDPPAHSRATQTLPAVYQQNASLEIAWTATVRHDYSISGDAVMPFFTEWPEGLDLNTEADWLLAEALVERGLAKLPAIEKAEI